MEIGKKIQGEDQQVMNEPIQNELAEYRSLTTDKEKSASRERIQALDLLLTKEGRLLINEAIYDD